MSERYRYDVYETVAIRVWDNELNVSSVFQPVHPDGRSWVDKAEAESWLADYLKSLDY